MRRVAVPLAAVLLAAGAPMLAQTPAQTPQAPASAVAPGKSTILERVLVRVNGEILTQTQLTERQIQACRDRAQADPSKACNTANDATLRTVIAEMTPDILVDAVDELLLVQRGRELNFKLSDENFKQGLENIKQTNKLDDEGLKKAMAEAGMTLDQLRSQFEHTYLIRAVQQEEIGKRMNLTEEEMRQYYNAHKDQFMTEPTVTIRELFVSVPTRTQGGQDAVNPAEDAAARAKANDARTRAMNGEDFVKLVTEMSESGTKANGGLIGPIDVKDLNPVLKDLLEKLQPGQVTEPARAPKGYQIFKLESRTTPVLQPFDQVREAIRQRIYDERVDGETQKLLERLRSQALIEWKDDGYKQMYEKRVAEKKAK